LLFKIEDFTLCTGFLKGLRTGAEHPDLSVRFKIEDFTAGKIFDFKEPLFKIKNIEVS